MIGGALTNSFRVSGTVHGWSHLVSSYPPALREGGREGGREEGREGEGGREGGSMDLVYFTVCQIRSVFQILVLQQSTSRPRHRHANMFTTYLYIPVDRPRVTPPANLVPNTKNA